MVGIKTAQVAKARDSILGQPTPAAFIISNIADFDDYVKIVLAGFPEVVPQLIMCLDDNNRLAFPKIFNANRRLAVDAITNGDNPDNVVNVALTATGAVTISITFAAATRVDGAWARSEGAAGETFVKLLDPADELIGWPVYITNRVSAQYPFTFLHSAAEYGMRSGGMLLPAGYKIQFGSANNVKYSYQAVTL